MNGDKTAVTILRDTRQLGCVFQDAEPPKSSSILRKSTKVLRPLKRVPFAKATLSDVSILEEQSVHPKFEDRSQEETERHKSDAPAEVRGDWPNISLSSKRRIYVFSRPKLGVCQRHLKQNRRKDDLL